MTTRPRDVSRYFEFAVPIAVAVLLLFAVRHQVIYSVGLLNTDPILRFANWALWGWEFLLAIWLFSGVCSVAARMAVVATFSTFGVVSFFHAIVGHTTCGCFGAIVIHPWIVTLLDFGIVASSAVVGRFASGQSSSTARLRMGLTVGSLLVFGATLVQQASASVPGLRLIGRTVIVEPELMTGRRLPLFSYIEAPAPLTNGRWGLLFHRADCHRCDQVIRDDTFSQTILSQFGVNRIALIEVPTQAVRKTSLLGTNATQTNLDPRYELTNNQRALQSGFRADWIFSVIGMYSIHWRYDNMRKIFRLV